MNADDMLTALGRGFTAAEDALAHLRRTLGWQATTAAVDPDGELATTDRMLRLKRGCRR